MSTYGECERCGHKGTLVRGICRLCLSTGYVKPNSGRRPSR